MNISLHYVTFPRLLLVHSLHKYTFGADFAISSNDRGRESRLDKMVHHSTAANMGRILAFVHIINGFIVACFGIVQFLAGGNREVAWIGLFNGIWVS